MPVARTRGEVASRVGSRIQLKLFGGLDAQVRGAKLPVQGAKLQALLAYLALHAGKPQPREQLATLLWQDSPEAQARNSLRQTLFRLRRALPDAALSVTGAAATLEPDRLDLDVRRFEALAAERTAAALAEAAGLYAGDLLAGFAAPTPAFDEWLVIERERLRQRMVEVFTALLAIQMKDAAPEGAIGTALALLAHDPAQEIAHRALMQLFARTGRYGDALRQYQICAQALQRELGVEPEPETRRLYQELVRARKSAPLPPSPATWAGSRDPLVGRERERGLLGAALDGLGHGTGRFLLLMGEAGMGKTRLLDALAAEAAARNVRCHTGHAYRSEQVLAFGPWATALRAAPLDAAIGRLEPAWRMELARLLPELDPAAPPTLPSADSSRLFEAAARLLTAMASNRPLVLMLEDMQWADAMSLRLLAFLSRRLAKEPVLLLATARSEELADAPALGDLLRETEREVPGSVVTLTPLTRDDTARLVGLLRHSPGADATERLVEHAWRWSNGNPFVIVETVQALSSDLDSGATLVLPSRVRELVVSRLERLSRASREIVQVAAVVGREFDLDMLVRAAGMAESEVASSLEELVRRQLVRAVGERFEFTHERIREVAYEQTRGRRLLLHARVAEAVEALADVRPEASLDALTHHYAQTDNAQKAVHYLTRFAEAAIRAYAHPDAVKAIDRARTHAERLPDDERDRVRVDLLLRRAFSMSVLGQTRDVPALLAAEVAVVDRLGDPHLAGAYYFRLGLTDSMLGKQDAAVASASRAIDCAEQCGDAVVHGKASYVVGLASFWCGLPARGAAAGEAAVRFLRPTAERHFLGMTYWTLGVNRMLLGDFAAALAALASLEEVGRELDDPRLLCLAASSTGWVCATMGDAARGVASCRLGLERARDPMAQAAAAGYLGYAHLEGDDWATAIPLLEQAARGFETVGSPGTELEFAL